MTKFFQIAALIAVAAFGLIFFSDNKADVNLWGNAGFVQGWPGTAAFRTVNTFSFTDPDCAWTNHEWLSEWIFHAIHDRFGNPGLFILKIVIGFLLLGILASAVTRETRSAPLRFLFLLLALSTIGYGFSFRPHLFTYLAFASLLYLLRYHAANRLLLAAVIMPLAFIWANLHGAFFIGIVILITVAGCETLKRFLPRSTAHIPSASHPLFLFALAAAFIAISFATPNGARLWSFIAQSAATPRPYLSEWAPFTLLTHAADHTDFIALALLSILALLFTRRPHDSTWLCLFTLALAAAFTLRRNIPLFAIVACFTVPAHMESIAAATLDRLTSRIPAAVAATLLVLFAAACLWQAQSRNHLTRPDILIPQDRFPTPIIQFLKEQRIQGNCIFFFDWAEYAIWHLQPQCRVFLDGRFSDAYRPQTINDYVTFLYAPRDPQNIPATYGADMALLPPGNPGYQRLLQTPGWTLAFSNTVAGLFLENNRHSDLIGRMTIGRLQPAATATNISFP